MQYQQNWQDISFLLVIKNILLCYNSFIIIDRSRSHFIVELGRGSAMAGPTHLLPKKCLGKERTKEVIAVSRTATRLLVKPELTTSPLLELQGIRAYAGSDQTLENISLSINKGEIVCLLGGKTSGKSVLLKVIHGLQRPLAGEVLLDGKPITLLSSTEITRRGVTLVPGSQDIYPNLTIEENLGLGAALRRGRAAVRDDMERILAVFPDLAGRRYQRAGVLNSGEQRMLTFARALMSRPRLICMDEPTKGLTPLFVEEVLDKIVEINTLGVTLFIVEQNAEHALSIATRAYVLQSGILALQGTASELFHSPAIRQTYLEQTA
jgi:branched-chain amino acid transport system ATP-binding protein